jgi:NADPH2:quinone reductase
MKAAVYYQNGGPEVLKYEDVPDPECHPKGSIVGMVHCSASRTWLATRLAAR